MKVNICYEIKDGPFGGGNQFLRALRQQFGSMGVYAEDPANADIILFNSHHNINNVLNLKGRHPDKKYVHRVDGPMRLYNSMEDHRDFVVYRLNDAANATVFQSEWSHKKNIDLGFNCVTPFAIISNATDENVFNSNCARESSEKTRLIAASWSDNPKKGFETYSFLDKNLDFDKYEFYFAGRSPVSFTNIETLGALNSHDLANHMRQSDIFITASENDPCSNSLIEALACGLPAVALNSGGHPELVGQGGTLFNDNFDLLDKIEEVRQNIQGYRENIKVKTIRDISNEYLSFFRSILDRQGG